MNVKRYMMVAFLIIIIGSSVVQGKEQDGFRPLSVDSPNPSFEGYPINIEMGSRESLNEAIAKRRELAVDVFYLPGLGDGVYWEMNISLWHLVHRSGGNWVHAGVFNQAQEEAIGKLAAMESVLTGELDPDGISPRIPAVLYFRIWNYWTHETVYSFGFGLYGKNMWVNGVIIKNDPRYVDVVWPFLPVVEADVWTQTVADFWAGLKDWY